MAAGVMPGGHLFYASRMGRYAKVKELSPTEAAYAAGIVDGEGTITLTTMHAGENRRLVVSVSSTERHLLEYLVEIIGAGRITSKRTYNTRRALPTASRTGRHWTCCGTLLLTFLLAHGPSNTYPSNRVSSAKVNVDRISNIWHSSAELYKRLRCAFRNGGCTN